MSHPARSWETKKRILDSAEILFAQRGYQGVSVRDIIAAAKCNVAAVNYHFGGKENLYLEVFRSRWMPRAKRVRHAFKQSLKEYKRPLRAGDVIRALTTAFLELELSEEERKLHHQLMAREIAQPSEAFNMVVNKVMKPFFQEVAQTLQPVMPSPVQERALMLKILSVFAQILYFNFARTGVSRITGQVYDDGFKNEICEHIIRFSLHGLGVPEEARC